MGKLFGTDGIRGIANTELTVEIALKLGEASAYVLGKNKGIKVLIGRDTRQSGPLIMQAIATGLMSRGAEVIDLGIVPTPAVSYLIKKYKADMGVMISASHNPSEYNGIKLFNNEGFKLPDKVEDEIEEYLLGKPIPTTKNIGVFSYRESAIEDYTNYLSKTAKNLDKDIKIVVDCAFGSASTCAPLLFDKLGVNATFINNDFDGRNINENAGSTHLEGLIKKVKKQKATAGIAYDGDADRCLMVDEKGNIVDGDKIMAISALHLKKMGKLKQNALVGTVMSNLGLVKFCVENDIKFERTKVGDRYVLEKMLEEKYSLGGEQSGHVIFLDHANTGDGLLTSVQMLNIISKQKEPLSKISSIMKTYPQVLVNVKVSEEAKKNYDNDKEVVSVIKKVEEDLKGDGRVLIRPSGTEPLIRVMIEGKEEKDIEEKANKIASIIKKKYGIK